jgi:hypothetical protein
MKKYLPLLFLILIVACKKEKMSPEGPTDIRVRNLSDLLFHNVTVRSSEKPGDTISFGNIANGAESEYFRFTKAYPKAEITAEINVNGSPVLFSTGPVDYTYMQYIGRDRITFEVYISGMSNRQLTINNVVLEEPLNLK